MSFQTAESLLEVMDKALDDSKKNGGGTTLLVIDPLYVLNVELECLRFLMETADMDGVLVSFTRPYTSIDRALRKHSDTGRGPYYVDALSSVSGSLMFDRSSDRMHVFRSTGREGQDFTWTTYSRGAKVFRVKGPFNLENVFCAIEEAVNSVLEDYRGDEYFLFVDNLIGFSPYVEPEELVSLGRKIERYFNDKNIHRFLGLSRSGSGYYDKIRKMVGPRGGMTLLMTTAEGNNITF